MGTRRMARDRCNGRRAGAKRSSWPDGHIVPETEYERGTRIAGWMLCAMFVVMTIGAVFFGW